mmetsp:Transcript_49963/g.150254  ORF Transcript_49963/g.150254 Transcript_49963/m.150254 type:complete len:116 (-) Transcript_49963:1014-1361(-)
MCSHLCIGRICPGEVRVVTPSAGAIYLGWVIISFLRDSTTDPSSHKSGTWCVFDLLSLSQRTGFLSLLVQEFVHLVKSTSRKERIEICLQPKDTRRTVLQTLLYQHRLEITLSLC